MFKNHALEPQICPCYGYLEQEVNLGYGIKSNKKTHVIP